MKQSGFGIASLVIGIVSLVFSCFGVGFLGILGFIFSIIAFAQKGKGKGTAIAGIITSIIAFLISFLVIVLGFSLFSDDGEKENNKSALNEENEERTENRTEKNDFSVEESELYNKKGILIRTTGNKSEEIGFYVENNSKSDINISVGGLSVNNICCEDDLTYEQIMSGNKTNFSVNIDLDWAQKNGIEEIKKIDILFVVSSDDSNFNPFQVAKTIKTDKDDKKYQKIKGKLIYKDKNMEILYLESDDSTYKFSIYSKYKDFLDYRIDSCSINGYSYDLTENDTQVFEEPLFPDSYGLFEISVNDDFSDKNSIKEVEKIEFKISADSEATTTRLTGEGDVNSKKITYSVKEN